MKFLLCSLINLAFIAYSAQAQTIPEGATGIELTTSLPDSTLFESVQTYLENEGFTIEKADEERGTITTDYKIEQGAVPMRVLVSIEKSMAVFTGQGNFESLGQSYTDEELINEGRLRNQLREVFLLSMASFPGMPKRWNR